MALYWGAQAIGALAAALLLRASLGNVAHVGATLPSGSDGQSFLWETVLTVFLMFVIMAVATDTRAVGEAAAIAIGGTVGLDALFGGPISGASMNPARSLGPALVSGDLHSLWIYLTAPFLGAVLGVVAYQLVRGSDATADGARAGVSRVLFVCIHNAGRSQMAAALLELVAGGRHEARSAGSDPGEHVHPEVVEVMRELGVDLADRVPHLLDRADAEWADVVVTMGCGDACPYIPGKRYVDWDLPDPKGLPLDEVRAIRDDIRGRVERLVAELDLAATVRTERLDLVLLDRAWLQAYADGKPLPDLGFADPDDILSDSAELVRWRLAQIAADPSEEPWLLRAIVNRDEAVAVGYVNFHAPPDERGMVEIGYTIVPSRRRQGYASEAADGMWRWAAEHGARILRASISPDNEPSLALIGKAGFVEVGSQIDEIDGLELIFEKPAG